MKKEQVLEALKFKKEEVHHIVIQSPYLFNYVDDENLDDLIVEDCSLEGDNLVDICVFYGKAEVFRICCPEEELEERVTISKTDVEINVFFDVTKSDFGNIEITLL